MNLSIHDEFHLFAEEIQRYLSPHILQQLAQVTGFVKRNIYPCFSNNKAIVSLLPLPVLPETSS
ncbi:hypothetical protein CN941_00035 [Bacillus cereus]|nr:hypothetical protein CN390_30030 [Bacillus cereus]PGL42099.1 hypothetical protein CN930_04405 [Bacillus cereus]PGM44859.1 hypothetical protein CN941_00035 [Bacillus cereus]